MILQSLRIALRNPYSKPGPENPYEAKLEISYNNTQMQVKMSEDTRRRILALAADEITAAAQVQINDFVRTAIAVSTTPQIEGEVRSHDAQIPF